MPAKRSSTGSKRSTAGWSREESSTCKLSRAAQLAAGGAPAPPVSRCFLLSPPDPCRGKHDKQQRKVQTEKQRAGTHQCQLQPQSAPGAAQRRWQCRTSAPVPSKWIDPTQSMQAGEGSGGAEPHRRAGGSRNAQAPAGVARQRRPPHLVLVGHGGLEVVEHQDEHKQVVDCGHGWGGGQGVAVRCRTCIPPPPPWGPNVRHSCPCTPRPALPPRPAHTPRPEGLT